MNIIASVSIIVLTVVPFVWPQLKWLFWLR